MLTSRLILLSIALAESGCTPMFPCGTPAYFKDCRPFGALQGDEDEDGTPPETPMPFVICRDANRDYYGVNAEACPKGDLRIG